MLASSCIRLETWAVRLLQGRIRRRRNGKKKKGEMREGIEEKKSAANESIEREQPHENRKERRNNRNRKPHHFAVIAHSWQWLPCSCGRRDDCRSNRHFD